MVFLCGRPGCGRESSATLQIDAPSSTISLVDPRVSRDGVALCPHHADSTTPPMGWSMNDLRSRNRTLAPVPSIGPKTGEIVSTRPKSKGKKKHGNPLFQDSRSSADDEAESDEVATDLDAEVDERPVYEPPFTFPVSRELQSMPVTASPGPETDDAVDEGGDTAETRAEGIDHVDDGAQPDRARIERPGAAKRKKAPASRPAKRREVLDDEDAEDDKFPWHYQFDDDEPEELQAKSPLLSRAFRSSVG